MSLNEQPGAMDQDVRERAKAMIPYVFKDPSLLELSLRHASTSESGLESNERLEFLGDAVLGLIVCEMVFRKYPELREGAMTKIKSMAVSRETCAQIARAMGLDTVLMLGKGMQTAAAVPGSVHAAVLESVIGAIYIDGGFAAAERFVTPLIEGIVERAATGGHQQNFKSVLQQHAQQAFNATPQYKILDEQGPDHAKAFKICVEIEGRRFEACWGGTKKKAEQEAALSALKTLGVLEETPDGELRVVRE